MDKSETDNDGEYLELTNGFRGWLAYKGHMPCLFSPAEFHPFIVRETCNPVTLTLELEPPSPLLIWHSARKRAVYRLLELQFINRMLEGAVWRITHLDTCHAGLFRDRRTR